jgi:hypothetical protein
MALPSSGAISFYDLQNEFGGSNPIGINEYYMNGGIVPNGTINVNNNSLPTSGQISLSTFYGSKQIPTSLSVRALIVGGGGGGHSRYSGDNNAMNGGGGAGGVVDATFNLPKGSYTFIIGSGGYQSSGGDTLAFGYTAYGGGMGGGSDGQPGFDGGSGGGGAGTRGGNAASGNSIQPNPTSGDYGNQPAYGNAGGYYSGSGGGAGGAGSGINGGPGRQWINGIYYAGGGGNSYGGAGGIGGGGTGPGQNAFYYGGGGSGASSRNGGLDATYGYQGIVIVSYQWDFQLMSGGSVTFVNGSGGPGATYRYYHTFTSSSQYLTF